MQLTFLFSSSFPLDTNGGFYSSLSSEDISRRDSHDSRSSSSGGGSQEGEKKKREGKDEKLAREQGITEFISVWDIINLPMGK